MENKMEKDRLYMSNLLGAKPLDIISNLENLVEKFFEESSIDYIKSASTIFFSYPGDIEELNQTFKDLCPESAYVIIDITDNLNVFDFRGYITEEHEGSKEFMKMINKFVSKEEKKENQLTNEEKLKIAIEKEDYETAAKLRDEMNSTVH
jgi:DNA repair exonuclease SbcCD nuclease subunit